jgi:hypothetical protein
LASESVIRVFVGEKVAAQFGLPLEKAEQKEGKEQNGRKKRDDPP